jgi:hypothetical protein
MLLRLPAPEATYDNPLKPILRYDSLMAVFVSPNPLRREYDLRQEDYDHIAQVRDRIEKELYDLESYLLSRRKNEVDQ